MLNYLSILVNVNKNICSVYVKTKDDLFALPSIQLLTAIHFLMYGTTALTHDNFPNQMPEFEAIESGITGCFFKENDPVNLKESIVQWLKKHPKKEDNLIKMCFEKIDMYYNPNYQIKILKEVLR